MSRLVLSGLLAAVMFTATFVPERAFAGSERFGTAIGFTITSNRADVRPAANPCVPPNPCVGDVGPAVPEPGAALAFAAGALVVGAALRRRRG